MSGINCANSWNKVTPLRYSHTDKRYAFCRIFATDTCINCQIWKVSFHCTGLDVQIKRACCKDSTKSVLLLLTFCESAMTLHLVPMVFQARDKSFSPLLTVISLAASFSLYRPLTAWASNRCTYGQRGLVSQCTIAYLQLELVVYNLWFVLASLVLLASL